MFTNTETKNRKIFLQTITINNFSQIFYITISTPALYQTHITTA